MASTDEDFPRGGTEKKTTESKSVKEHEVDNLFQTPEKKGKKRKNVAQQNEQKATKQQKVERGDLKLNATTAVEILHLRNLSVGTLMLGCVKQVTDFEAVVGFPSGLVGYLQICNICDAYSSILMDNLESEDQLKEVVPLAQLLTPGTLIRCVVLSLDSVKEGLISLKVSVNPKDVNKVLNSGSLKPGMTLSGCVESVEDHGFLVDIGISGTKAFLPKQSTSSKKDMNVGQYVTILLEEVKNDGRVVRLSQDPQALRKAFAVAQQGWTLDTLLPGLLIQGKIKRVTPHGLIVTYLSSFTGVVDFLHLDEDKASTYSAGDEVVARVLYVDPSTRHVGLSLRGHLLPPSGAVLDIASSERISEVVEGCKMTALHHQSGALMKMPDGTAAFVHKNLLKEASEEFNPNRLLTQPEHTLRIIDYSPVEQMHIGTLRRSTVEVEFFRYQDIKVGQILEGTVTYLQKYGAYVRITDHIRGFIPNIHLADVVLKNPEKLFTSGRQVKCRVLSVDAQQKKLCLTRKKALVESTLPLFLSYADAKVGRISHGYIVSVKDFGCIVRFYGDVKGLVPMQELSKDFVTNPEELFFVGQVVQAKVLTCTEEKNLLRLSFRAINEGDINEVQTADFQFEVGKTVEVKVYRKVLDGLEVSIVPEEVPAFIPTVHLSDHVTNCLPMWTVLEEGDTFSVTCLSKTKKGIILTRKPLLKASLEDGSMPKIFSELQVGLNMVGWVKSIMDYGLFIHFPYGLFGLAPKSVMCDEFITDTSNIFNIGQTVVAKVTNLDHENHRFLVSLKVSELSLLEEGSQARLVQGLKERKAIFDIRSDSELSGFSLGDKLKVTVGESKEDGTVTLTSDKLSEASVLVSKYHTEGVNVSPGCKLTALVLHVDLFKSEVHVTLLPELTGATKKKLEKGSKLSATIQFTDKDFAVVSLGDTGHLTIISTHLHINDVLNSKKFIVGSSLDVTVEEPSCEALGGLPLAEYQKENERKGRSTSTGVRELMTVKVKKVKPMEVTVTLPSGTTGSVHVSQISESPAVGSFPTSTLKIGSEVKARVIGARSVHTRKFLPFSHPDFSVSIPVLSLLPSITGSKGRNVKIEKLNFKPGDDVICFASKFDKELQCLDVHVKPNVMGTVDLLSMIKKPSHAQHPHTLFKVGQTISAKVVRLGTSKPFRLSLSLIGTYKLEPGMITMAKIWKIVPHMGMFLQLPFGNRGLVSVTDLSDEFTANPLEPYKLGQLVRCYIIEMKGVYFNASLRPSRLYRDHNKNITDPEIQSILDVKSGQIVRGYVTSFVNVGIFVRLSRAVTGRVVLRKATKYFVENEKPLSENIPVNFLVTAKVLSVNTKDEHVKLSLLTKDTGEPDILPESLELPLRQIRERELKKEQAQKGDEKATKRKQVNSDSQQEDDETDGQTIKKKKVTQEKQEHDEEAPDMKQVNPGSQQQDDESNEPIKKKKVPQKMQEHDEEAPKNSDSQQQDESNVQTIKKKKVPQKKQEHDEEATNMKQVNSGSQQQDDETNGQTIKKKKVPQKKQEHDEEAPKNSDSQQQDESNVQTIKKKKVPQKKQHDEEAPDMKQVNSGSQQQDNETNGQTIKKKKVPQKKQEHDEEAPKNSDSQQQDNETDGQTVKKKKVKQKKQEHDEEAPDMKQVNPGSQQQDNETDGQTIKKKKNTEKETLKTKTEDNDSGVEVFFREEDKKQLCKNQEQVKGKQKAVEPERLQVSFGFPWESTLCSLTPVAAVDDTHDSSEDEQEVNKAVKKTRKELKQEEQNAEQQLSKLEAELMDTSTRPDSTVAFERLLLSSPNSSLIWLQYMAFHLQATQIEQARAVGEKALKTISFREEQEKMNVWVAMLNLENMYGTQESLQKVFERAIQYCEPLPVYQQLADIYAKSDKIKEAESLYKNMVKRFKQEGAVYLSYGTFLLRQHQSDAANALLQRALQSLSNKEHVDLIAKFARLEFQYGSAERAKSMFDKVLSTYPKRTDLWSVFIDLMVKYSSQKEVRELFDRVIHLSVSVKKIKFFFKRYLEYEKKNGTPQSIQTVKQKALEYVESKGAEADS